MDTEFLTFAHQLADRAGQSIRPYFEQVKNGTLSTETKSDDSPVTIADREAEKLMREMIAMRYPGQNIFGEEFGQSANITAANPFPELWSTITQIHSAEVLENAHRYTWVIDPIDGTRAFLAGKKEWGTLIALCEDGIPILGILDQPVTGERWVGMRGIKTEFWSCPRRLASGTNDDDWAPDLTSMTKETASTRMCLTLSAASISTTSRNHFTPPQAKAFVALANQCDEVIENGDCYAYGLLARSERDVVVDAGLKPYDILALVPIIEGAGGKITTWDGASVTLTNYANVVAAGDTLIHADALSALG